MKKIILFMSLAVLAITVNAQSLKVQSAISDLRNKRLDKAKTNIDEASEHESTKNDAKTWRYKAVIYYELAVTDKDKYKNLAENPLQVAYESAVKCKELDKENEYVQENTITFRLIGAAVYNRGIAAFEKGDYKTAIADFEEVVKINNLSGERSSTNDARYNAALAAEQLRDTAAFIRNYQALINAKYDNPRAYKILYQVYKQREDTIKAMDVVTKMSKNLPNDPDSYILLATAYAWTGNTEKTKEALQNALNLRNDPEIVTAVGVVLEQTGDIEGAKARYTEALKAEPNSYDANYYLGALYFNQGVDKVTESNSVPPGDKTGAYERLLEESKVFFNNAIPYLEKAVEIKPNDVNGLNALKQIYARLENYEKVKEIDKRLGDLNQ